VITRRTALVSLMSLLAAPHAAEAQQAGKPRASDFSRQGTASPVNGRPK